MISHISRCDSLGSTSRTNSIHPQFVTILPSEGLFTDMTLVDEDMNSILADDTNRAIPGNLEMQMQKIVLREEVVL